MSQPNPKRHHILPRKYQAGFAGPDGRVWVFDRRRGSIACENPENVAVEKHFYRSDTANAPDPTSMESFLANHIEGPFWPVLERLERQEIPTSDDRLRISMFAAFLLTRTPTFRKTLTTIISNVMVSFPNLPTHLPKLNEFTQKTAGGLFVPVMPKNASLDKLGQLGIEAGQILCTLNTHFLYAPADEPFITTDNPFVLERMVQDDQAPTVSATSFMKQVPLSAKVAVGFGLPGNTMFMTNVESKKLRDANVRIATAAKQIILSRTKEQLESILSVISKQKTESGSGLGFPSVVR